MKKCSWLLVILAMAGCERNGSFSEGHSESYKSAMADYQAGRLEVAIDGFKKAVKDNPSDAGARFQLASLLQDGAKDYMGAYCAYNEFLILAPASDKARLAKERMLACERAIAPILADRYSLTDTSKLRSELDEVKAQLKLSIDRTRKLEDDLAESIRRSLTLKNENAKLMTAIRNEATGTAEEAKNNAVRDAKALLEEEEDEETDRIASSADIAALRLEGENESGSELLKPVDNKKPEVNGSEEKPQQPVAKTRKPEEPPHEERPEEYVVQEGETLSKIAMRFYGSRAAWKKIRDANKATISVDGRVISGQRIKLP